MVQRFSESANGALVRRHVEASRTSQELWNKLWSTEVLRPDMRTLYLPDYLEPCALLGKRVLDVGSGFVSDVAIMTGSASYMGIDHSEVALIQSLEERPDLKLVLGDASRLPFGERTFDVVISIDTLTYLGDKIGLGAEEMARVSRERLIFSVPFIDEDQGGIYRSENGVFDSSVTTVREVTLKLNSLGFELLRMGRKGEDMLLVDAVRSELKTDVSKE